MQIKKLTFRTTNLLMIEMAENKVIGGAVLSLLLFKGRNGGIGYFSKISFSSSLVGSNWLLYLRNKT